MADANQGKSLTFYITDKREVITHDIDKELLLRVVKRGDMGWDVEVNDKSEAKASNLLYHSPNWHGPHPSQIYAWHIAENYFPNERMLEIRGHRYEVKIILTNTIIDGKSRDARFVSGKVNIVWKHKP
jgi:hypothetical protein